MPGCDHCGKPLLELAVKHGDSFCSNACAMQDAGLDLPTTHNVGPGSLATLGEPQPTQLQRARARRDENARRTLAQGLRSVDRRQEADRLLQWGRELDAEYGS